MAAVLMSHQTSLHVGLVHSADADGQLQLNVPTPLWVCGGEETITTSSTLAPQIRDGETVELIWHVTALLLPPRGGERVMASLLCDKDDQHPPDFLPMVEVCWRGPADRGGRKQRIERVVEVGTQTTTAVKWPGRRTEVHQNSKPKKETVTVAVMVTVVVQEVVCGALGVLCSWKQRFLLAARKTTRNGQIAKEDGEEEAA